MNLKDSYLKNILLIQNILLYMIPKFTKIPFFYKIILKFLPDFRSCKTDAFFRLLYSSTFKTIKFIIRCQMVSQGYRQIIIYCFVHDLTHLKIVILKNIQDIVWFQIRTYTLCPVQIICGPEKFITYCLKPL